MASSNNVVMERGFYTSTKGAIMQAHGALFGCFALSLDYVSGATDKRVFTHRAFVQREHLERLLDGLFDRFGNYHLNYLVFMSPVLLDAKTAASYGLEMDKFIRRHNGGQLPEHVPFRRDLVHAEFHALKDMFKPKGSAREIKKVLFVNDNIRVAYRQTRADSIR